VGTLKFISNATALISELELDSGPSATMAAAAALAAAPNAAVTGAACAAAAVATL